VKRPLSFFGSAALPIFALVTILFMNGCTNISGASKSSTSLSSFLGFSELPDWYVRSKYRYSDSKWIDNDFGTSIHYRDVGEGPVVVLLHGEISSLHTWDKWIERLSQDFRVIAIDLPGSGLTSAPHCIDDTEETCAENLSGNYLAHTFEYFIEDLGIDKFSLVGSSYGGYLAAQYTAHQHPEKIDKLILMTPMGFQQDLPWILDYVTKPGLNILNRYFQPSSIITTIVDNFYGESDTIQQVDIERYIHLAQTEGAHESNVGQLTLVRMLMEYGMLIELSDISHPTLVMWGELDSWGDFTHAERWDTALGNSTLVTYPTYGHALMEEDPVATAEDVAAFINDEPLPTIEGLGFNSFTIEDALQDLDKEALFGKAASEANSVSTQENEEESLMEDVE